MFSAMNQLKFQNHTKPPSFNFEPKNNTTFEKSLHRSDLNDRVD